MIEPYVIDGPTTRPWFGALAALDEALAAGDAGVAEASYAAVARALVGEGSPDLAAGVAAAVLFGAGTWADHVAGRSDAGPSAGAWPDGVHTGALVDLRRFAALVRRAWRDEVGALLGSPPPAWRDLAAESDASEASRAVRDLAIALQEGDDARAWAVVAASATRLGAGPLARFEVYAWEGEGLRGVPTPATGELEGLVGLERPLARLLDNVEAFLSDRPSLATLLYGPRGSGKSTAVRGLLPRYRHRGLRLVEVPGHRLDALPAVLEALRRRPHHFVLYLDDLAFDEGDAGMRPLKSLLEGSVRARPPRVLVIATSNRRHLVRERFGDRPDPLDADVHAWDTHHDRLALADRFGLTITFPGADQRAYLAIVRALAQRVGIASDDLDEQALRFAAWGNGLSGRTARQFVDALQQGTATGGGDAGDGVTRS